MHEFTPRDVTPAGVNLHVLSPKIVPDPEVIERPLRRRFPAAYKLRILQEVDARRERGQIGVLLRREGLYSSHLTTWRRQRDTGAPRHSSPKNEAARLAGKTR